MLPTTTKLPDGSTTAGQLRKLIRLFWRTVWRQDGRTPSKYAPHQGAREMERRVQQRRA